MEFAANLIEEASRFRTYQLSVDGTKMTWRKVLDSWQNDPGFSRLYLQFLADVPYEAYFWEHPPLTLSTLDSVYEVSFYDSPALAKKQANSTPFSPFFVGDSPVVSFLNLGGDARLVVPRPSSNGDSFTHLGLFVRTAEERVGLELLALTSRMVTEALGTEKLYLSTSGLGVYWLHIRLDKRPKYYQSKRYREW